MQSEAMVIEAHGGPDVLVRRSLEVPEPGPREVRVAVRAVALNHLDLWVRRGGPAFKLDYPHRLGSDICGVVEALGPGAIGVTLGQRVVVHPGVSCGLCGACRDGRDNLCRHYRILGESTQGGYARHLNVPDVNVLPVGDSLDDVHAAAAPLATMTAWQMAYRKGQVFPGANVLVNAAGSGVSTMLIQLCKIAGARVITTTSTTSKVAAAKALGADEVVLNSDDDWVKQVKALTGRVGVDVAFDHVGGRLFEQTLQTLRWGGRVVICGATAGHSPNIDLRVVFFKQLEICGSTMGSKGDLVHALAMLEDGRLRVQVDRVLSLWDAAEAHRALESRAVFGKVVLLVDPSA